jgi:hypothetical protein
MPTINLTDIQLRIVKSCVAEKRAKLKAMIDFAVTDEDWEKINLEMGYAGMTVPQLDALLKDIGIS